MVRDALTQALAKVPAPCQLSCSAPSPKCGLIGSLPSAKAESGANDIALLVGRKTKNSPHEV
jgi:hypothetical protein